MFWYCHHYQLCVLFDSTPNTIHSAFASFLRCSSAIVSDWRRLSPDTSVCDALHYTLQLDLGIQCWYFCGCCVCVFAILKRHLSYGWQKKMASGMRGESEKVVKQKSRRTSDKPCSELKMSHKLGDKVEVCRKTSANEIKNMGQETGEVSNSQCL